MTIFHQLHNPNERTEGPITSNQCHWRRPRMARVWPFIDTREIGASGLTYHWRQAPIFRTNFGFGWKNHGCFFSQFFFVVSMHVFFFASLLSSLFLCLFVLVMNQCQRCQKGHDMCPTDMGFKLLPTSPNKAATFDGYQALVPPGGASGDLFGISAT